MENINLDYNIEWGILIHQLPKEFMGRAIRVLPRDVKHTFIDESGMRVYFQRQEKCDEFIRKKFIDLDGILFNIYSTVTCLTVFGISSFASRETIETYLKAKGMCVHELYQILDTSQYRIILDVPEVLANIDLDPISLDSKFGTIFPIEFYCRVCRREGHKQYQCQHTRTESHGADDTGNGSGGASSNNARNSNQGNAVKPSVSGTRNTGGRTGTQSLGKLSARENANLPKANPSTSSTTTTAESLTRTNRNMTSGSNKVLRGKIRTPLRRSVKDTKRSTKAEYPCNEIVRIIMNVPGILSPPVLCKFLEEVHFKKDVIKSAWKFTQDIPQLIKQIRSIISHYNQRNYGSSIASNDIKILAHLCKRLDLHLKKSK